MSKYFSTRAFDGTGFASKAKLFLRSNIFHHHFYLPEVEIRVQNDQGVVNRLVQCLSGMGSESKKNAPA